MAKPQLTPERIIEWSILLFGVGLAIFNQFIGTGSFFVNIIASASIGFGLGLIVKLR